ncbi:hypothetical protein J5681_01480 [bacterium]|nr:hypothetical protein [bacterium]
MISVQPDTLVTGIDRWFLEKLLDFDFFWYANPFEHSKSKGFILPQKDFSLKIPAVLVVDLSEIEKDAIFLLDPAKTVFYSEEWRENASVSASFVRNIVNFSNGKADFVKKDYKIVC